MAQSLDLFIDAGSSFSQTFLVQDGLGQTRDLTGYTIRSEAKRRFTDTQAAFAFTVQVASPTSGQFTLILFPSQSENIPAGLYVYDVKMSNGASIERVIQGICSINAEVTQ